MLVDEYRFTVEEVDICIRDFTMHQQRHTNALHGLQSFVSVGDGSHTRITVGGCTCGVELYSHYASVVGLLNFARRRIVGKVERHQGLKNRAIG